MNLVQQFVHVFDTLTDALTDWLNRKGDELEETNRRLETIPHYWWRMAVLATPPLIVLALLWWFR